MLMSWKYSEKARAAEMASERSMALISSTIASLVLSPSRPPIETGSLSCLSLSRRSLCSGGHSLRSTDFQRSSIRSSRC